MKILVCGDREWGNYPLIKETLESYMKIYHDITVIHDNARGADKIGAQAASDLGLKLLSFPADWSQGKKAGPIRNKKMLDEKPDLVLAFHNYIVNSKGTKNCVDEAMRRGITVKVIKERGHGETGSTQKT